MTTPSASEPGDFEKLAAMIRASSPHVHQRGAQVELAKRERLPKKSLMSTTLTIINPCCSI